MAGFEIRRVRDGEMALLPAIEADAAEAFREVGLEFIADQPPMAASQYCDIAKDGCVFVAVAATGEVVGFAALGRMDGQAWLREMSVRRDYAGQGIGRALLGAATGWARDTGFGHLVLTTFADIAFNGPFYRKSGFQVINPDPDWPQLAKVRNAERSSGIEIAPRVAMKLVL